MRHLILDKNRGSTDFSLEVLQQALSVMAPEYARGEPVKIYELRDFSDSCTTRIGFYLKTPEVQSVIGHSFWVPHNETYEDNPRGGAGTRGYRRAVAMMYRHLNHQPRTVVGMREDELADALLASFTTGSKESYADDLVASKPVEFVIDEGEHITPRLLDDLYESHNGSFIVLDTKREGRVGFPDFALASTWDMWHGTRTWGEYGERELVDECDRFDWIVTYGHENEFESFCSYRGSEAPQRLPKKNVNLHKHLQNALGEDKKRFTRPSEVTLASVALGTLGLYRWEAEFPNFDSSEFEDPQANASVRDVELIKELFFHMLENSEIYYVSQDALKRGLAVDRFYTHLGRLRVGDR